MRKIELHNGAGDMKALILPDYGGMMARLIFRDKEIISYHEDKVHLSAVLSCGNPILFPFAGRTAGDCYQIDGREYYMPFHGLVKEAAFGVREVTGSRAVLWIDNSAANRSQHYPFDCRLEITYELAANQVRCSARVINRSNQRLVHSFGWHPFFKATDKAAFGLNVNMSEYMDWETGKQYRSPGCMDCKKTADYVFTGRKEGNLKISNPADGYEALIETSPAYKSLVVCTAFAERVCVEPWIGPPDAVHQEGYPEYVNPGDYREYPMTITLKEV